MEGFTMTDLQALSINRDDHTNGSFRKKRELVSNFKISFLLKKFLCFNL